MREVSTPEELTIYTVSSWREVLLEELPAREDMKIDCSKLEELDAAGVQLLLSLKKTTFQSDFSIEFRDVDSNLRETLELAGVEELLLGGVEDG